MEKNAQHTTLYRQYRPNDFDEVRGQEHIVKSLEGAIKNKRIAHAYLFSGSRGTGKTSIARILAKKLGVTEKDLYEIDAASNTGVDNIRELREGVIVRPFESPYKFYIIDEAHMLSKAAWNALLKTLEEPPSHAIFVLATTEKEKVPDTIQSRCEIYTFKQPTREVLAQIVTDVAKSEGFTLEKSAAELVALLAEGSFRDALSILQKVLAVSTGKKIASEDVEQVTGSRTGEIVRNLVSGIAKKDASMALKAIKQTVSDNMDARVLAKLLIIRMRAILLLRYAPDLAEGMLEEMTEADLELAKGLVKDTGITSDTLKKFLEAYGTMAYAALPHLPLELAIMDTTGTTA